MEEFLVPVRNEFTGEIRVISVVCAHWKDAQLEALHELFRCEGWSKATALEPDQAAKSA